MSEEFKIDCGPVGKDGRRLFVATFGKRGHRDKFDGDSDFHRRKFRESLISKWNLSDDLHEPIEQAIISAADAQDDERKPLWEPSLTPMSQVEAKKTKWLWEPYFPAGAIVIVDGNPGLGKSQFTIDIAARNSRGNAMPPVSAPDGSYSPRGTLILNAEDDPARTLRPRLDAAGADISRIHLLRGMNGFDGEDQRPVSLPMDLPAMETIIIANDISLVVIDPFVAYLDAELNMNSDADVRRCLGQVASTAERTGVCFLLIRHLNKKAGLSAIHRGGGSVGITGAARAAFLIGADPDDKDQRVLAPVKCNLAPEPPSLSFTIESVGNTSRIRWGNEIELSAQDLLKESKSGSNTKTDQAKEIINDILGNGQRGEREVKAACADAEISESTYWRARKSLGIESEKAGYQGEWLLSLPSPSSNGEPFPF